MFSNEAVCPTCHEKSIVILQEIPDGTFIGACHYCDMGGDEHSSEPYINHCWKCGWGIDSRSCQQSRFGKGYHCNNPTCRVDLVGNLPTNA